MWWCVPTHVCKLSADKCVVSENSSDKNSAPVIFTYFPQEAKQLQPICGDISQVAPPSGKQFGLSQYVSCVTMQSNRVGLMVNYRVPSFRGLTLT